METSTLHQHGILTKNYEKLQRTSHTKLNKKKQNSTLQIGIHTRRFGSKDCLIAGQLAIHGRQLGLELLNFTVQPTDGGKHSVFLGPLVQKQIVTTEVGNVSL